MTKKRIEVWKFVCRFPIKKYKCGLKEGDKLRQKAVIVYEDSKGRPTGEKRLPSDEIWTVLCGAKEKPLEVWLKMPNGESHLWDDDKSIFDTFELIQSNMSKLSNNPGR